MTHGNPLALPSGNAPPQKSSCDRAQRRLSHMGRRQVYCVSGCRHDRKWDDACRCRPATERHVPRHTSLARGYASNAKVRCSFKQNQCNGGGLVPSTRGDKGRSTTFTLFITPISSAIPHLKRSMRSDVCLSAKVPPNSITKLPIVINFSFLEHGWCMV